VFYPKVGSDEKGILVERRHFMFFMKRNFKFTLESLDINYVIEATGKYKTFEDLNAHIIAGAKKVILSAPSEVDSIKLL
jgi:glyceraldehyde 3-phosphate dehydrogenase